MQARREMWLFLLFCSVIVIVSATQSTALYTNPLITDLYSIQHAHTQQQQTHQYIQDPIVVTKQGKFNAQIHINK